MQNTWSGAKSRAAESQKKLRLRNGIRKIAAAGSPQALNEVANSNLTMRAFAGGRQKSWMANVGQTLPSPINTTFRSRTNTSDPAPTPTTNGSHVEVSSVFSRTPITPTPTFAIPEARPKTGAGQVNGTICQETVLPSPAPSEDNVSPGRQDCAAEQVLAQAVSDQEVAYGVHDHVRTSGEASDSVNRRPSYDSTRGATAGGAVPKSSHEPSRSPVPEGDEVAEHENAGRPEDLASPCNGTPASTHEQPGFGVRQQGDSTNEGEVTWSDMNAFPRNPISTNGSDGASMPRSTMRPIPSLDSGIASTTSSLNTPLLKPYVQVITQYVEQIGGVQRLNPRIDLPRMKLLEYACANEDMFYVALHQLYCLYTETAGKGLEHLGFDDSFRIAFVMVGQLICHNEHLTHDRLMWFAKFPSSLEYLLSVSKTYHRAIVQVKDCLAVLPTACPRLDAICTERDFPPLTHELVVELKAMSPTLQRVIFTAVHRNIWGATEDVFFRQVEEQFHINQCEYYQVISRMHTAQPVSVERSQEHIRVTVMKYKELRARQLQFRGAHRAMSRAAGQSPFQNEPLMPRQLQGMQPSISPSSSNTSSGVNSPVYQGHVLPSNYPASLQRNRVGSLGTQNLIPQINTMSSQRNSYPGALSNTENAPKRHLPPYHRYSSMQHPSADGSRNNGYSPRTGTFGPGNAPLRSPGVMPVHPSLPRQSAVALERNGGSLISTTSPNTRLAHAALLRAQLRNPHPGGPAPDAGTDTLSLYRSVTALAHQPYVLSSSTRINALEFSLSPEAVARIAHEPSSPRGNGPISRLVQQGSLTYRVRCCKMDAADSSCNDSEWLLKEHIWPSAIFVEVNGVKLEVRRKVQHGKDQHLDITKYVRQGRNEIKAVVLRNEAEESLHFALAVETIEFMSLSGIMQLCGQVSTTPGQPTSTALNGAFESSSADDEISIVDNRITVNITDPFTSRIFDIPVRGAACLHRDCFDLETFLQTRASRSKAPGEPCNVDDWRCPLCGRDARPTSLRIDGFLRNVRAQLEQRGLLNTRAIVVKRDGGWEPKEDDDVPMAGQQSGSPRGGAEASGSAMTPPARERVVIELDDD